MLKKLKILLFTSVLLLFAFAALFHELSHEGEPGVDCNICKAIKNCFAPLSAAAAIILIIVSFVKFVKTQPLKISKKQFIYCPRAPPSL